jgi:hypothetical protein
MAALVLGIGTSIDTMLSCPPGAWQALARADHRATALPWRGSTYSYEALAALRGNGFVGRNTPDARRAQADRCRVACETLAAALARAKPDAIVVVGDDGEGEAKITPAQDLSETLGACARAEGFAAAFDCAAGNVVRGLLGAQSPPLARLRFDAAAHDAQSCFAFGAALGRAVRAWDPDARVAVIAAGGMSGPAIDEALDRRLLDALASGDPAQLLREPESSFRGGAAGFKGWILAAGALDHAGLDMLWTDYVPCIRTEAGTGNAMAFAVWS